MNKKIVLFGLILIAVVLVSGCAQEGKPTIKVKSPVNGSTITSGSNLTIELETTNLEGAEIFLLAEGTGAVLNVVNNRIELKNMSPGTRTYRFTARKNGVTTSVLASVTFTVKAAAAKTTSPQNLMESLTKKGTNQPATDLPAPPSLPTGKFVGK